MHRLSLIDERITANNKIQSYYKGKTIVVTGGSRGIGLGIALKCAK